VRSMVQVSYLNHRSLSRAGGRTCRRRASWRLGRTGAC
jgi:hypothetical protein